MLCEIIKGSERIRGPFHYEKNKLEEVFKRIGAKVTTLPVTLVSPETVGVYTLMPVISNKPSYSIHRDIVKVNRTVGATAITYDWSNPMRDISALRAQLIERVAGRHNLYELEHVEIAGVMIKADLEARINASETLKQMTNGSLVGQTISWRGKNGKITVDSSAVMSDIYEAIFNYLTYGFMAKEYAENTIEQTLDQDLETIDPVGLFDQMIAILNTGN